MLIPQNKLKMGTPFLHVVNQLHASSKMWSAEPVLLHQQRDMEEHVSGINVVFQLETCQTNKAVHLLEPA